MFRQAAVSGGGGGAGRAARPGGARVGLLRLLRGVRAWTVHPARPPSPCPSTQGSHYLDTRVFTNPSSEVWRGGGEAGRAWRQRRLPPAHLHAARGSACGALTLRRAFPYLPSLYCCVVAHPPQVHEEKVAASATCFNASCDRVALKVVNFSSYKQRVAGESNAVLSCLMPGAGPGCA